jgi:DNA-directed RNA polymerase specialized sigma54-like protein
MLWVQQGNWDRLKLSSQHLPSMVVEKCYYMLNHYLDNLLSANGTISTFGPKEASAINQLATAIKKVRNRSAVNESMEMMSFFLDDVRRKDPTMAEAIMPFIEQYIAKRKDTNLADFLPANFNDQGFVNEPTDDIMEQWLDEQEHAKMEEKPQWPQGPCRDSPGRRGPHQKLPRQLRRNARHETRQRQFWRCPISKHFRELIQC